MKDEDKIVAFAMATLSLTNGVCPFCRQNLSRLGGIYFEDVRKHIDENNEWEKWKNAMNRYKEEII